MLKPRFFPTAAAWRKWLAANHRLRAELWVGFWRVASGRPSITWPQSVDEALCFGWIDGLRRGLDADSYTIRFTPRAATSRWSQVNLKRYAELMAGGRVRAAGRNARASWDDRRRAGYSYEAPPSQSPIANFPELAGKPRARRFWEAQIPSYRRVASHWVTSAKRPETRARRLATLVDCCARGAAIPPLAKYVKVKPA